MQLKSFVYEKVKLVIKGEIGLSWGRGDVLILWLIKHRYGLTHV